MVPERLPFPSCLVRTRLLSWGCQRTPLHRPALHRSLLRGDSGFRLWDLTTTSRSRPSCHPRRLPLSASAGACQASGHVPPPRFLTALTVSSEWRGAGLLHPAADHGVRRVSGSHRNPCESSWGDLAVYPSVRRLSAFTHEFRPFGVHSSVLLRSPDRTPSLPMLPFRAFAPDSSPNPMLVFGRATSLDRFPGFRLVFGRLFPSELPPEVFPSD
jgi:hypothetical protein